MIKGMKGVCFLHCETGTEGGWWAVQEDGFADKDGYWSYHGLRYLEEGDNFAVHGDDGMLATQYGIMPPPVTTEPRHRAEWPMKTSIIHAEGVRGCCITSNVRVAVIRPRSGNI